LPPGVPSQPGQQQECGGCHRGEHKIAEGKQTVDSGGI
jgi:hypothetical protein